MGKVDRLRNRVEPFAFMFWALGILLTYQHLTLPTGPGITPHKACPFVFIVGPPPPFPIYLFLLFIYAVEA